MEKTTKLASLKAIFHEEICFTQVKIQLLIVIFLLWFIDSVLRKLRCGRKYHICFQQLRKYC